MTAKNERIASGGAFVANDVFLPSSAGRRHRAVRRRFFGPTQNPAVDKKWSVLPPVLILHGGADHLVFPTESEYLVAQLEAAGKKKDRDYFFERYEKQGHGFKEPDLTKSRNRAIDFIKKAI